MCVCYSSFVEWQFVLQSLLKRYSMTKLLFWLCAHYLFIIVIIVIIFIPSYDM